MAWRSLITQVGWIFYPESLIFFFLVRLFVLDWIIKDLKEFIGGEVGVLETLISILGSWYVFNIIFFFNPCGSVTVFVIAPVGYKSCCTKWVCLVWWRIETSPSVFDSGGLFSVWLNFWMLCLFIKFGNKEKEGLLVLIWQLGVV